jgi:hypothetical protein
MPDYSTPKEAPNRAVCERCGRHGRSAFTYVAVDGKLDLRRLCADCCGLLPLTLLGPTRRRQPGQRLRWPRPT